MKTDSMIKPPINPFHSTLISNLDSSPKGAKSSSKKEIPKSPTIFNLTKILLPGETFLKENLTKEVFMNNSKLWIKSEKEISLQFISLKNIKTKANTQSKPSLKKQLTVNKKERNALLKKLKSWDTSLIQTTWGSLKSLNLKTHFTSFSNF